MENQYMVIHNMNRCAFTGDALFIGGCGKFLEGDASEMLSIIDTILSFPDDTKIFCGHEFTASNLEFCAKIEGSTNP